MRIKLYMDYMSQPSRAVHSLFLLTKTPFEIIEMRIAKFENLAPGFLKLNPLSTVPFIHDPQTNIFLSQSHAIMRYLSNKSLTQWYPIKDFIKTCKIDEYLDFHHCHTRKCHYYVINTVFAGRVQGKTDKNFDKDKSRKIVEEVLNKVQACFFRNNYEYLVANNPSIADLSAFFQIQFLILTGEDFERWPILKNWMKKMSEIKEISLANQIFMNKLVPKINPQAKIF